MTMLKQLSEKIEKEGKTDFSQVGRSPGPLETSTQRIDWALAIVKDQNTAFESLLDGLRLATQAVSSIKVNPIRHS
jgi:hypothetical protein